MTRALRTVLTLAPFLIVSWSAEPAAAAEHRIGIGAHFWKTVDDLADDGFDDIEEDGLAWVVSYQYLPRGLLNFEIDLEYYDDGFGGSTEGSWAPIGFVLLGNRIYVGAGVGVTVLDGLDDVSDPFYVGRVGYQIDLLGALRLDINANYRANAFSELDEADTDAVTLGVHLRVKL